MEFKIEKLMDHYYICIYPESLKIINGMFPSVIVEAEDIAQKLNIPLQDYIEILEKNGAIKTKLGYFFKDYITTENVINILVNS